MKEWMNNNGLALFTIIGITIVGVAMTSSCVEIKKLETQAKMHAKDEGIKFKFGITKEKDPNTKE